MASAALLLTFLTHGCGVAQNDHAADRSRAADLGLSPTIFPAHLDGHPIAGACVVRRIVDGDTRVCAGGTRIRLLLIDAPETGQGSSSRRAKLALEEVVSPGDTAGVELDVQERDRYRRILAHLHVRGVWVNRALVREGYAVPLVYPPNVRWVEEIRAAADSARAEGRGLWAEGAFRCLPRDFRAGRCGGG